MARGKFIGLQYPLVKTPRGTFAQKSGVDQIKADMLQLLLTNPGERVMLPEYGTPLKRLFFEPNDTLLEDQARKMILDSLNQWEPRVAITDIIVTSNIPSELLNPEDAMEDKEHILFIKIEFVDPEDITEIQELALEIPLGA